MAGLAHCAKEVGYKGLGYQGGSIPPGPYRVAIHEHYYNKEEKERKTEWQKVNR